MRAFDLAWSVLKALPEQQLVTTDEDYNYLPEIMPGMYPMGTLHPAALGAARRQQAKMPVGATQIQRLQRPDVDIHPREGKEQDMKTYGVRAFAPHEPSHPDFEDEDLEGDFIHYDNPDDVFFGHRQRIEPDYPPRHPIFLDSPLGLEGGR